VQGLINHATLLRQFSQALEAIANVLPQIKLGAHLYQTPMMQQSISRLYVQILLFLQKVVKWYNMSTMRRALDSILNPFELGFQDTVTQIRRCSEDVEATANAAARAEIRDVNVLVRTFDQNFKDSNDRFQEMQSQFCLIQDRVEMAIKRINETVQIATGGILPALPNCRMLSATNK